MFAVTLDLSGPAYWLSHPEVFFVQLLYWVGWVPIAGVLIYGFFEVYLFNRQEHYRHKQKYVLLAIDVPKQTEQSPKAMEHFFAALSGLWGGPNPKEKWIDGEVAPVISLELVSDGGYIQYYIRIPSKFRDIIEAALYSAYPDTEIYEAEDYVNKFPDKFPDENYNAWGCEQSLSNPDYLPIRTYEMFEHKLTQELKDTLALQLEQYAKLQPGEQIWTQYILEPLGPLAKEWHKPGIKYIYKEIGKEDPSAHKKPGIVKGVYDIASAVPGEVLAELGLNMFGSGEHHEEKGEDPWKFLRSTPVDKARLDLVTQKIGKPAMHVKIRHMYIAPHAVYQKGSRDKMLKAIYTQFTHQDGNRFGRVGRVQPKTDYTWQKWWENTRKTNIMRAYKHRDAEHGGHHFILNTEELATLWHFPTIITHAPFITKTLAKRAEPPVQLPTELEVLEEYIPSESGSQAKATLAPTPIDFAEPRMPARKVAVPTKTPVTPKPSAPATRQQKAADDLPDNVRALFDPNVEFRDQ